MNLGNNPPAAVAAMLFVLGGVGLHGCQQARKSQSADRLAKQQAEAQSYASNLRLAAEHLEKRQPGPARQVLWETPPDRRHWEWGYLLNQAYQALAIGDPVFAQRQLSVTANEDAVCRVFFSPDGRRVLATLANGAALVFDPATGALVSSFEGHARPIHTVEFTPKPAFAGALVVTAAHDGTVRLWNSETGAELWHGGAAGGKPCWAAFDRSGERIIYAPGDGAQVSLLAVTATGNVAPVEGPSSRPAAVAVRPGTRPFLVGRSAPTSVSLYDPVEGRTVDLPREEGEEVVSASLSHDGERILTFSNSGPAKVWDVATKTCVARISQPWPLAGACFSPRDSRRVLTAPLKPGTRMLTLWDVSTAKPVLDFDCGLEGGDGTFTPDGKRIAVTYFADRYSGPAVRVWDAETGKEVFALAGQRNASYSQDGRVLATVSWDEVRVTFWEAARGGRIRTLDLGEEWARNRSASPDGRRVALAPEGSAASVHDTQSGETVLALIGHENGITDVQLSPDGKRIATASEDRTARLWDASTGEVRRALKHQSKVNSVRFDRDGRRAVTACDDGTVWVWDAAGGAQIHTLRDRPDAIRANRAQFSPDGRRIVAAYDDGAARVWDAETGKKMLTLASHRRTVLGASFSPDGRRIATISPGEVPETGEVRVWDAETGQALVTLVGALALGPVDVRFSPDGRRIAALAQTGMYRTWTAAPWRLDDLPGTGSWPARFDEWRRDRYRAWLAERRPQAPTTKP